MFKEYVNGAFSLLNTSTKDLVCYVVLHVNFVHNSMGSNYMEIAMAQFEGPDMNQLGRLG